MNWRRNLVNDIQRVILPVLAEKNFPGMTKTIFIDVQFEKILDGIQGFCMEESKCSYTIVLNRNMSKEDLIVNMCHELVHVCQANTGMEFNYDLPYFEQPHEIEAYAMQEELANIYKEKANVK